MAHIFTNAEYANMLSSHELQSALMLTVEFLKMYEYYTRQTVPTLSLEQ
jgi:hypothetical protein